MNIAEQMQETLKTEIKEAVMKTGLVAEADIPAIVLEKPKEKAHGDYAANIAMQLARAAKKAPRQIAEAIVEHIDKSKTSIEKVEIAGPGFINFYLDNTYLTRLIPSILHDGADYGRSDAGRGQKNPG